MFLNKQNKGQTWSFDLLIAVVIFIIVVGVFYAFLSTDKEKDNPEALQDKARMVSTLLDCDASPSDFCVIQNGEIIHDRLVALSSMTSEQLAERGLEGVFCLYLEDKDGNLIPIGNYAGIGSSDFELTDTLACNEEV